MSQDYLANVVMHHTAARRNLPSTPRLTGPRSVWRVPLTPDTISQLATTISVNPLAAIGSDDRMSIWVVDVEASWSHDEATEADRALLSPLSVEDGDDPGWYLTRLGSLTAAVVDLPDQDALDILDEESGDLLWLGEALLAAWQPLDTSNVLLIDDLSAAEPFGAPSLWEPVIDILARHLGYGCALLAHLALPPRTDEDDDARPERVAGIEDRVAWWRDLGFDELGGGGVMVRHLRD